VYFTLLSTLHKPLSL